MNNNQKDKPISLVFVVSIVLVFIAALYYISLPSDRKNILKSKTFEEQLEYGKISENKVKPEYSYKVPEQQDVVKQSKEPEIPQKIVSPEIKIFSDEENMNALLDELAEYPSNSLHFVEVIVNKILEYTGYPSGMVRVLSNDINKGKSKIQGSYMTAYFDIPSGNIYVDSSSLYSLDKKLLIAILCHELDHFDKMAKIAKSMGAAEFTALLESKNIAGVNREFWNRAARCTDINDFDSQYYLEALQRLISKHELELTSSYSDFYKLSENMRNPLELSAYGVSDYIEKYYKINKTAGAMRQLTEKFNEVDWAVYDFVSSNPILKTERIALFDYFFMKAVVDKFPELQNVLNDCISTKNGDLTLFWLAYEKKLPEFYIRGRQLDGNSFNIIMGLLSKTGEYAKQGANAVEIANALKYKSNTIISNIVYPNAIKNIKMTSEDYLKFTKEQDISSPEDELNYILTLICIENELYTSNEGKSVVISQIKMPEVLTELYPPVKRRNKYYFIYDNPAFKKEYEKEKSQNEYLTQESFLKSLINGHRLAININP